MPEASQKILVTSALPYANGPIHIGHMVEYIQTDVLVRYLRAKRNDVIYVCADDTHGAPIEINARKQGITPEQLIGKYYREHIADFSDFLIKFDSYYTTNSPENKKFAERIFTKLKEKGFIYQKEIELTYCETDKRFLPDRYVKGKCPVCGAEDQYGDVCEVCNSTYKTVELIKPYCVLCGNPPVRKNSRHHFFRLSAFSQQLREWLENNSALQKDVVNFVTNWINKGLEDWCISRDGPYFGFLIPGETDKYYYVWLDAPIGYIASTDKYCKHNNRKVEDYWMGNNSRIMHVIGKDIIYFHFLFWPAILMGAELKIPDQIIVHGFLTVNKEKMSKSRGTFITARDYLNNFSPELLRFYYASNLTSKPTDIDLDFNDFKEKVNNELVANLANFCYRVLSFVNKNFGSELSKTFDVDPIMIEIEKKIKFADYNFANLEFREAVKEILAISSLGNKFFQDHQPWKLIKRDREKAQAVATTAANIARILAILCQPILPNYAEELRKQLNIRELNWNDLNFNLQDHKIGEAKIIFEKMEKIEFGRGEFPLNIKVAKITGVDDHPNADKLLVLQLDLGAEKRQIVAGIKKYYSKAELLGKLICILTNLKPAQLRGVESNGMLLAADNGENVKILEVHSSDPGELAYFQDLVPSETRIEHDVFAKLKIEIKNQHAVFEGKTLRTDREEVVVDIKDGSIVR